MINGSETVAQQQIVEIVDNESVPTVTLSAFPVPKESDIMGNSESRAGKCLNRL